MKKIIGAVVALLVVLGGAWVGSAWYAGKRLEAESQDEVTRLNAELKARVGGVDILIVRESYERGAFVSNARYALRVKYFHPTPNDPAGFRTFEPIVLDVQIDHGPLPLSRLADGELSPRAAAVHAELARTESLGALFDLTKGRPLFAADVALREGGDADFTWKLGPVDGVFDGAILKFSGANAEGSYTHDAGVFRMQAAVDELLMDEPPDPYGRAALPGRTNFQGIALDLDSHLGKFGVMPGSASLDIKKTTFSSRPMNLELSTRGAHFAAVLKENEASLNAQIEYQSRGTSLNGQDLGSTQARVRVTNLDGKAVQKLAAVIPSVSSDLIQFGESSSYSTGFLKAVLSIMDAHPTVTMDPMRWKTPHGESSFVASMDLSKPGQEPDYMTEMLMSETKRSIVEGISRLNAKAHIDGPMVMDIIHALGVAVAPSMPGGKLPAGFDEKLKQDFFKDAEESRFLTEKDGSLQGIWSIADGVADLNGVRKPVQPVLEQLSDWHVHLGWPRL